MDITSQSEKAPFLRDLPSRLLGQTSALVSKAVSEVFDAEGTHRHQFSTLATLEAFGASSQADLCRRTDIDRSDMNAAVNALEAEGAVTRTPDPNNRRQNIVELTDLGRKKFNPLRERIIEAQNRVLAPLSQPERRELIRLLQILHDHIVSKSASTG